jgi:nucleotide-binding universal stress UspA family protein
MTTVLFPTDFSKNAEGVIEFVLGQFKEDEIKPILYHSIEPPKAHGGAFVSIEKEMTKIALEQMDKAVKNVKKFFKGEVEGLCRAGFMEDNINAAMQANQAKLCVMCSKGESNIAAKVFGSKAELCLKKSQYPIWILPTTYPPSIKNISFAAERGYLNGKMFLEQFLQLFKEDVTLCKIQVITDPKEIEDHYREEEILGKEVKLHQVHSDSVIHGIDQWITDSGNVDTLIINTYHTKWYNFLLNHSTTQKLAASLKVPFLSLPNLK